MKKILILLLFLLSACSQPEGYDSQGHAIQFKNYQGRWLIVNYWASWCSPCLTEMPGLNAFYNSHRSTIMVLGVNFDGINDEELNQIAEQRKINYPLLSELNNPELKNQDFSVLPVSFIFNPQGKLVKILRGPQTEKNLLTVINQSPSPAEG